MTKIPRIFHAEDLKILLDFVIANSHFESNGHLFRQERGVAMGSPAAPPLCDLVATVEDFFQASNYVYASVPVTWFWCTLVSALCGQSVHTPSLCSTTVGSFNQLFLSLEFYRPPVFLETQHDTKVLGYLCDSLARSITPQLPDHPSQLKGVRSASDEVFTYSSWSSRSWVIIRGASCPTTSWSACT